MKTYHPKTGEVMETNPLLDRIQGLFDIAWMAKHDVTEVLLPPEQYSEYIQILLRSRQYRFFWPEEHPEMEQEFAATPVRLDYNALEPTVIVRPK